MPYDIENLKLFCLEGVADIDASHHSPILPALESLALQQRITSIYKTCDTIEGLEESLSALLYGDNNFSDYSIIYLVFGGKENSIILNHYYYSLEEIAEVFEGKLKGKILHFANTMNLELSEDAAQYFIDVTGARAVSGYSQSVPILSTVLDCVFFDLCQEHDDVVDIVEELYQKQYALSKTLGFTLYY
ncbi:DUF6642 family protein [Flavobacterium sp.]|uniref:DUF6642 family protein n=1 Tax=Flavobacterium sp. TaxID=239 RepID=UPI003D6BF44F